VLTQGQKAAGPPKALSAAPEAIDLLRALQRRWLVALVLALVAGPAGAVLVWCAWPRILPPGHTARTTVHVSSARSGIGGDLVDRGDFVTYQKTQIAMVKSRLVLSTALQDSKVAELRLVRGQPDPVSWLEKNIKADYATAPEILSISLSGDRPAELVLLVDVIRETYLREIVNRERNELQSRLNHLKEFYDAQQEILRRKRDMMRQLAQSVGAQDPLILEQAHQHLLERMSASEKELMQVRSDLRKAQAEAAAQEARTKMVGDPPLTDGEIEEELKKDPLLEQRRLEAARLEEKIESARATSARDGDPGLQRLTPALEAAKKAVAARRELLRPLVIDQLREKSRYAARVEAAQRQEKIAVLQQLEEVLNNELKNLEVEVARIKNGSVEIDALRQEIGQSDEAAKKIGDQVQALTVAVQAPARVTLLEAATATEKPDYRLKAAGGAGLGAFTLALLGVAWLEFRVRRIRGPQEVAEGLGIKLVGAIPDLPRRQPGRLGPWGGRRSTEYWRRLLTESIDVTRGFLVRAAQAGSLRVVMVTSALEGEGKTTLASHLAVSLARAGFRTLLIDADLRRPILHRMFAVKLEPGFNEILRGEAAVKETVRATDMNELWLLPAGRWEESESIKALARDGIKNALRELRPAYDFIIVDSSPVLPVVDPLVIGQQVDGVIFSILRDVSRLPSVYAAQERMADFGIRILGAVINGAREGVYESTYQLGAPEAEAGRQSE
jgi:capsular exopolysaccharide synthesis family protein